MPYFLTALQEAYKNYQNKQTTPLEAVSIENTEKHAPIETPITSITLKNILLTVAIGILLIIACF